MELDTGRVGPLLRSQRGAEFSSGGTIERAASLLQLSEAPEMKLAREHVGPYLDAAALLGRRTAELHLALASPTENPAFSLNRSPPGTSTGCARI